MASYGKRSSDAASWEARPTTGWQDLLLLLARVLLGAIFVESGFGKLTNLAGFAAGLEGMGVPMPMVAGAVGAAVEFFGGLAIVLGAWTALAAILVAGFTVAATLLAHRFWDVPAEQQRMQHIQFMKNLAIIGGLLALVAAGAGRWSVDGVRRRR
ncbi:DoxX family protein [Azospirillum sp.]|uniref:DoxX family protein n=1 Tax=Azospirillum sp. TaxID=34012 RepID=UPI002D37B8E9|nr:DoxX family protein [Azospirillum sp.]HYD63961.1 DoxX family protein [Azospirillum sp.]